jgi:Ni/Co efflux regulator RcnB
MMNVKIISTILVASAMATCFTGSATAINSSDKKKRERKIRESGTALTVGARRV